MQPSIRQIVLPPTTTIPRPFTSFDNAQPKCTTNILYEIDNVLTL